MRIRICRKEAKETQYWLSLTQPAVAEGDTNRLALADEAGQLMRIFASILHKTE